MIAYDIPASINTCNERLKAHLEKRAIDLKTGRGGLTYDITPESADKTTLHMEYRVNWLIGAHLKGTLTAKTPATHVNGQVKTNTGVYLTIGLLNFAGIAATFVAEAGFVAWFAAVCISAFISFLVIGIRQGLANTLETALNTTAITQQHTVSS